MTIRVIYIPLFEADPPYFLILCFPPPFLDFFPSFPSVLNPELLFGPENVWGCDGIITWEKDDIRLKILGDILP